MRRTLQKFVESPLSVSLLSGEFRSHSHILVDVDESKEKLTFTPVEKEVEKDVEQVAEKVEQ